MTWADWKKCLWINDSTKIKEKKIINVNLSLNFAFVFSVKHFNYFFLHTFHSQIHIMKKKLFFLHVIYSRKS